MNKNADLNSIDTEGDVYSQLLAICFLILLLFISELDSTVGISLTLRQIEAELIALMHFRFETTELK